MSASLTCTALKRAGSRVYMDFSDGHQLEFETAQDARDYVRRFLNDSDATDFLRAMFVAKLLKVSADGSDPTVIRNKTLTLDLSLAANLVRLA